MSSRICKCLIEVVFCIVVARCQRPIVEELTAVTIFPEVGNIFTRLHPETNPQKPTSNNLKYETNAKVSIYADGAIPDTVTTTDIQEGSPRTELVLDPVTTDPHQKSSTQNQPDGSELSATTKKKICEHISSSGIFAMVDMAPRSLDKNKTSFLMAHPRISSHLFKFEREKEEGTGHHLLPRFTLSNVSKKHRIYVRGHRGHHLYIQDHHGPYIERMISCVLKDETPASYAHEYYVSDREYNLSTNPTEYIAGRFIANRDRETKRLLVMGLAEQPATVVIPKNEASLYASLKKEHAIPSEWKYPTIRRLSESQTLRLCSSVMSGIKKSFDEQLVFFPSTDNVIKCRREKMTVRLRVDGVSYHSLDDAQPWMITCKGQGNQFYNLMQADEDQNGVFVSNDKNEVEIVWFYASRISALNEVQDSYLYSPINLSV